MSISVRCAGCDKNLKAKDELAGRRLKCPSCGHVVVVPAVAHLAPQHKTTIPSLRELPAETKAKPMAAPPPIQQSRWGHWSWYAGGVAAAVCLIAGVAFIFAVSGENRNSVKSEKPQQNPQPTNEVQLAQNIPLVPNSEQKPAETVETKPHQTPQPIEVQHATIIALDDSDYPPVILIELKAGMDIRISDVEYAPVGWLESYAVQVQSADTQPTLIRVQTKDKEQAGNRPTYMADIAGSPLPTLKEVSEKRLVGFSVEEPGGVKLLHSGTISMPLENKTEFSYDANGRRQIARQDFTHEGSSYYELTYSDYLWREDGRLGGYSVHVVTASR